MSGQQVWTFGAIEGAAGDVHGSAKVVEGLLTEGKGSLAALQSVWQGQGLDSYQSVQMRWDTTAAELNTALSNLANTISEAGQAMMHTEGSVASSFGG
ncbi:WXG100 family type VII secretion target [Mycobacterium sp. NPDC003449]